MVSGCSYSIPTLFYIQVQGCFILIKQMLKTMYRSLPLKREAALALRALKIMNVFPRRIEQTIKRHFLFEGVYKFYIEGKPIKIQHGYGRDVESAIFWYGLDGFEGETIRLWLELSSFSSCIIDVGANTGVYSLVAKRVNQNSQIYAFEPIERIFAILQSNVELNKELFGGPSIVPVHAALSDYSGVGQMYDLPVEHMYTASLNRNIHIERGQKLPSIVENAQVFSLDDFVTKENLRRIDLVKIDVESHEPAVLRGMRNILERDMPTLIVEIWNSDIGREVQSVLSALNYNYYAISQAGIEPRVSIINDNPERGFINYLICRSNIATRLGLHI